MDGAPEPRVLLAVGDPEREHALARALEARGATVAGRCLDAGSLLEATTPGQVDVAVVAATLHRLSPSTLETLRTRRVTVVLVGAGREDRRLAELGYVAGSADARDIASAVLSAARDGIVSAPASDDSATTQREASGKSRIVALTSGKGAPGKTTLAAALAGAWSAREERVVLVDADPRGGDLVACLDLDPRRGLAALAAPGSADQVLSELQDGPGFAVLAGREPASGRQAEAQHHLVGILQTLGDHFDRVVVDAGPASDDGTPDLLREAGRVLLVSGGDLVALWNTQRAVRGLRDALGTDALAAVLNRREGREQYGPAQVARALGIPVAGVVREDRRAAARAVERQVPLSRVGGRAARDVRRLAHDLEEPAEVAAPGRIRLGWGGWRRPRPEGLSGALGD